MNGQTKIKKSTTTTKRMEGVPFIRPYFLNFWCTMYYAVGAQEHHKVHKHKNISNPSACLGAPVGDLHKTYMKNSKKYIYTAYLV
jgi:hypothetical protein